MLKITCYKLKRITIPFIIWVLQYNSILNYHILNCKIAQYKPGICAISQNINENIRIGWNKLGLFSEISRVRTVNGCHIC